MGLFHSKKFDLNEWIENKKKETPLMEKKEDFVKTRSIFRAAFDKSVESFKEIGFTEQEARIAAAALPFGDLRVPKQEGIEALLAVWQSWAYEDYMEVE